MKNEISSEMGGGGGRESVVLPFPLKKKGLKKREERLSIRNALNQKMCQQKGGGEEEDRGDLALKFKETSLPLPTFPPSYLRSKDKSGGDILWVRNC